MMVVDTPLRYMDILLQEAFQKHSSLKLDLKPSKVAQALIEEDSIAINPEYAEYISKWYIYNRTASEITVKIREGKGPYYLYETEKKVSNPYYDPDFDIKKSNNFPVLAEKLSEELKNLGDIVVIGFRFTPMSSEYYCKDQISVIYQIL